MVSPANTTAAICFSPSVSHAGNAFLLKPSLRLYVADLFIIPQIVIWLFLDCLALHCFSREMQKCTKLIGKKMNPGPKEELPLRYHFEV